MWQSKSEANAKLLEIIFGVFKIKMCVSKMSGQTAKALQLHPL